MDGKELKKFRTDNNITLTEFERISGVSRSALSRFELYNATITTETAEAIKRGMMRFYIEKINELEEQILLNIDEDTLKYVVDFHKSMLGFLGFDLVFEHKSFYVIFDGSIKYELNAQALIKLFYKTNDFYIESLTSIVKEQINTIDNYLKVAENEKE